MISVRLKTPLLEVAVASDKPENSLSEIVKAAIEVGASAPVQNSLQAPIFLNNSLTTGAGESLRAEKQLALFPMHDENTNGMKIGKSEARSDGNHQQAVQHKRLTKGKGERAIAYNKIHELFSTGFFAEGGKSFREIQRGISAIGYTVSDGKLADTLLRLVRERHLTRKGESGSYVYEIPLSSSE